MMDEAKLAAGAFVVSLIGLIVVATILINLVDRVRQRLGSSQLHRDQPSSLLGITFAVMGFAALAPSTASADWVGVIELEDPTGHATDREWVDTTGAFSIVPAAATSRRAATFVTNGHLRITLVNDGVVLADETVNGRGRLQFVASGTGIGGAQSLFLTAVNDAREFIPVYQNHDVPAGSQVMVDIKGNYGFVASDRVLTSATFDDGVIVKSDGAGTLLFTVKAQSAPKSL